MALATAAGPARVAGAGFVTGLGEVFGLNKSASVFFAGEADGLTAGDAEATVVAFAFRPRLAAGEAEASVPAAGDALVAGEAALVASAFLCVRCFFAGAADSVGDSAGAGDWASATQMARPIAKTNEKNFVVITRRLGNSWVSRQDISHDVLH